MSDILCGYTGDREGALMAYLYGEISPDERAAFDAHLASCARCRTELAAFGGVRRQLARWSPPDFASMTRSVADDRITTGESPRRAWWRDVPAWAQVAAATLFLGVSAGVANLDVHYDGRNGLNVRTGWSSRTNPANVANPANAAQSAPWRTELAALEQQLRSEMRAIPAGSGSGHVSSPGDADVMRRVKALVDDSERRQQRELALRVTALMQDLNAQRQADLRRIDQNLGLIQDRTGVEVLRNRQMIDYYIQRASQRP